MTYITDFTELLHKVTKQTVMIGKQFLGKEEDFLVSKSAHYVFKMFFFQQKN